MFSYHQKSFGRRTGSNIAAVLSYRSGIALKSNDDGLTKYPHRKNKDERIISFFVDGEITKYHTQKTLQKTVNEVEEAEQRKDACVGKEILIALPKELTNKQILLLSATYAKELSEILKTKITVSIHDENNNDNFHAHIVFLDRHYENGKYATKKNRYLGVRTGGRELTQLMRHRWELLLTKAYKKRGIHKDVSCFSHADRQSEYTIKEAYSKLNKAYSKHGYKKEFAPDFSKIIEPDIIPTNKEYYNESIKENNILIKNNNSLLLKTRAELKKVAIWEEKLKSQIKIQQQQKEEEESKPPTQIFIINNNTTIIKKKKVIYKLHGLGKLKKGWKLLTETGIDDWIDIFRHNPPKEKEQAKKTHAEPKPRGAAFWKDYKEKNDIYLKGKEEEKKSKRKLGQAKLDKERKAERKRKAKKESLLKKKKSDQDEDK